MASMDEMFEPTLSDDDTAGRVSRAGSDSDSVGAIFALIPTRHCIVTGLMLMSRPGSTVRSTFGGVLWLFI